MNYATATEEAPAQPIGDVVEQTRSSLVGIHEIIDNPRATAGQPTTTATVEVRPGIRTVAQTVYIQAEEAARRLSTLYGQL